jgi:HNH endonuclease
VARRSQPTEDLKKLTEEITRHLEGFAGQIEAADVRTKVRALVPAVHKLRDLGSSLAPSDRGTAGSDRIISYLLRYPFTIIDGDELMVVSGIGEWARRVRELRVQHGWWIYSGVTFREMAEDDEQIELKSENVDVSQMRPDQYILMRTDRDEDAAERWAVLNRIRKQPGGVKNKLLEYLRHYAGRAVSGEDLRYLAKDRKEWARRSRELRTEDGWPVATRMSGREDLQVGIYVLEEDKQAEPHDRHIPDDVRVEVLTRDGFKCTECGWSRDQLAPGDPRTLLELHHITFHVEKGDNSPENLITLCNVHHDKIHREHRKGKS